MCCKRSCFQISYCTWSTVLPAMQGCLEACLIALRQTCHLASLLLGLHWRIHPIIRTDVSTPVPLPVYLSVSRFSAPFKAEIKHSHPLYHKYSFSFDQAAEFKVKLEQFSKSVLLGHLCSFSFVCSLVLFLAVSVAPPWPTGDNGAHNFSADRAKWRSFSAVWFAAQTGPMEREQNLTSAFQIQQLALSLKLFQTFKHP